MKNIHVLPTDKPSRLYLTTKEYVFEEANSVSTDECQNKHIYITSDEEIRVGSIVKIPCGVGRVKELHWKYGNDFPSYIVEDIFTYKLRFLQKEGELQTNSFRYEDVKKIILTTDQELIKDGVQAIDDEFLEWFVNNPSCEKVEVKKEYITPLGDIVETCYDNERLNYKIIIPKEEAKYPIGGYAPGYYSCKCVTCDNMFTGDKRAAQCEPCAIKMTKEEPKQETLEEAAEIFVKNRFTKQICNDESYPDIYASKAAIVESHILFAKWQQEQDSKLYSEEEVKHLMTLAFEQGFKKADVVEAGLEAKETDTEVNWIFLKHKK